MAGGEVGIQYHLAIYLAHHQCQLRQVVLLIFPQALEQLLQMGPAQGYLLLNDLSIHPRGPQLSMAAGKDRALLKAC